jgi:hypothetical protein
VKMKIYVTDSLINSILCLFIKNKQHKYIDISEKNTYMYRIHKFFEKKKTITTKQNKRSEEQKRKNIVDFFLLYFQFFK